MVMTTEMRSSSSDGRRSLDAKYDKEICVQFSSAMPHGLLFQRDDQRIGGYTCVVQGLDGDGQAAAYNEKCKTEGEYGLMIVGYLCVRLINDFDMAGKTFETVLETIKDARGTYTITFADIYHNAKSPHHRTSGNGFSRTSSATALTEPPPKAAGTRTATRISITPVSISSAQLRRAASVVTGKTVDGTPLQSAKSSSHLHAEEEPVSGSRRSSSSSTEVREQYETVVRERNGLRDSVVEKERAAREKSEQVDKLQKENKALQVEITALRKEREDSHHQTEEMQVRLSMIEREGDTLKNRLHSIEDVQAEEEEQFNLIKAEAETSGRDLVLPKDRRYSISSELLELTTNSAQIALLKQLLADRDILRQEAVSLQHEVDEQNVLLRLQQEKVFDLEHDNGVAKDKIKELEKELKEVAAAEVRRAEAQAKVEAMLQERADMSPDDLQECISTLSVQLEAETRAKMQAQAELEASRSIEKRKREQQAQNLQDLLEFKRELVKGVVLTKYGHRGQAHQRQVYTDDKCTWLSWRDGDGTVLTPRSRVKLPLGELLEVLVGAKTPVFRSHPPRVPTNCVSLVFLHPCRTVDLEVENAARARFFQVGFQLLLDEAVEARKRDASVEIAQD